MVPISCRLCNKALPLGSRRAAWLVADRTPNTEERMIRWHLLRGLTEKAGNQHR